MNHLAICYAIAQQPGIGSQRIISINGVDSLVDPVGAVLVFAGVHPLELQYYQNISTDKLWHCFSGPFTALDLTLDELGMLFRLVDTELSPDLDPKTRRDKVISAILIYTKKNERVSYRS
jgi:hypothetical protein